MLTFGLLYVVGAASAQLELSIEQAIAFAADRNEEVLISKAGVQRARGEETRARAELLPQLFASASYLRTLSSEYEGVFDPSAADGLDFSELPFGRENNWRFGFIAAQSLYAGGRSLARRRSAKAVRGVSELALTATRAQAVLQAAQAYYDAVLGERLLAISEATLARAIHTMDDARVGRRLGSVSEFDLLRAEVSVDNQRPVVLQARIDRNVTLLRLQQLLELPTDREVRLISKLEGELAPVAAIALGAVGLEGTAEEQERPRITVREAELTVQAREAQVDIAFSQHLPSVDLTVDYGRVAYVLAPSWTDFRENWTVGVALSLPLFQGGRVVGDVTAAEADLLEARARQRQVGELAQLDTKTAREELDAARALWEATARSVEQAARAYSIAEVRYREGISTQLELSDARLLLARAEVNRARAARDLQVGTIRVALLPVLPVTTEARSDIARALALQPEQAGASSTAPLIGAAEALRTGASSGVTSGGSTGIGTTGGGVTR